ncbi:unnamed protein product [Enterobius vermicularis]|uniref:DEK_C domain-containing protein n=1 Tax=Enterobius vermicularis TaxID=51028 RepID=A0A0N4VJD2_ENTVE|nr:unnamed protein product [Enterobius vermicularis]
MTGRKKDSGDDDYNDHGYDDCDGGNTNSSEDVLQFLLSTANSSTSSSPSSTSLLSASSSSSPPLNGATQGFRIKNQEKIEIDLDETRSELLRILQSQIHVEEDATTHEKLQTITEVKFRAALDEVLKRQLNQARLNHLEVVYISFSASTLSSQLVCQFFVFGTLFGVVCSISTCTCCLKPRSDRRNAGLSEVNPTNVPAPIDYSKPYMLKCDSRGSCYASPLSDDEVPPLPSYADALECARQPTPTKHSKSNDDINVV